MAIRTGQYDGDGTSGRTIVTGGSGLARFVLVLLSTGEVGAVKVAGLPVGPKLVGPDFLVDPPTTNAAGKTYHWLAVVE